ncbi:hypothetical protein N2605_25475 [Bradyrhizobium yuanmingense]|uniref:hypothetical protein n=1 Tax=Bradyrhizobium yuanmingense TaxID=108015 RepID=UPI0021A48EF2|nr:hypothetical protein [Bradyrhizobium sp. CB1024]UWU82920.1 hypothetical protein N2605_25475 [Bradyrhizobium sp. CB1024]
MNSEFDFAALVERNATYTPGKTAIHFELKTPSYFILNRHIKGIARAFESYFGVQRGDRSKILSLGTSDASGPIDLFRFTPVKQHPIISAANIHPTRIVQVLTERPDVGERG